MEIELIIINIIMVVFGLIISLIYYKSKIFHSYPYYFNIFYITTVLLNNIIRLPPKREEENEYDTSLICYIQGISLTVLDKLMLCEITSYSVVYFLGIFFNEFYTKYQMLIFLFLSEFGFILSLVLATIFSVKPMSVGSEFCYVKTRDDTKIIVDTTVTSILGLISIFCTIMLLIHLIKLKKESNKNNQTKSIKNHIIRFSFNLILNIIMFTYIILIINKKLNEILNDDYYLYKDMFYLIISFISVIFFTVNMEVLKETKRMITCQSPPILPGDGENDENSNDEKSSNMSETKEMEDK